MSTVLRLSLLSQNGLNGPHPAESFPPAVAGQGRRSGAPFLSTGEQSSGRSCLPHTRFPPSETDPNDFTEGREALARGSRCSLLRVGREERVVARDSTRDSMRIKMLKDDKQLECVIYGQCWLL